jgi:dGTPase
MLAPYASDAQHSRGRRYPVRPSPSRNAFERDRDRIVHSAAFRRLAYKTQVFLNHEGDLFRSRLTHSVEVAQLARSVARGIGLHEDLCEAIALAHDLGHTPFGHAGQDALDECFRAAAPEAGGFEHNLQSLRVVDELEERYPEHAGLNLTFETREGILKHCSRRHAQALEVAEPGGPGRRFIDGTRPSLEAQVCNLADEIAYNAHDIDDGVRAGLLEHEQLRVLPLFERHHLQALRDHPSLHGRRLLYDVLRRMLSGQIHDLVESSRQRLHQAAPASADEARRGPALIGQSAAHAAERSEVNVFLRRELYRHPSVVRTTEGAKQVVRELFAAFVARPDLLPAEHAAREPQLAAIVDYIAGMTDRFALAEHARLVPPA